MLILILAILSNFYKPAKVDINALLPKPGIILRRDFNEIPRSSLAPHPVNFHREVYSSGYDRYAIAYENNQVLIRADTAPEFPFIIKGPGESGYWVQISKGQPWISLKAAEDKIKAFKSFFGGGVEGPPKDRQIGRENSIWNDNN